MAKVRRHSIKVMLTAGIGLSLVVMALLFWFQPSRGTLADFVRTRSFTIAEIPRNLSGITYCAESGTLFLVSNTPTRIYETTPEGRFIRQIDLEGFYDTEDIAFIEKQTFAVVEEKRRTIIIFQILPETKTVHYANCRHIQALPPEGINTGLEGLTWDPDSRTFLISKEANPRAVYTIPYNGVGDTDRLRKEVTALHNLSWIELGDYAGIYFDSTSQRLLILSQKSGNIKDMSMDGHEKGSLNLSRFISGIVKTEGLTVGPEGNLYVCSEPNQVFVFSRNLR